MSANVLRRARVVVRNLLSKARKKWYAHGFLKGTWIGVTGAFASMQELLYPHRQQSLTGTFDSRFGVETSRKVDLLFEDIESQNYVHASPYQPTPIEAFMEMMGSLDFGSNQFVFVDYGSGKGRTLLLASEFPFKRIIGVEFSENLHRIAERNIRAYESATQRCKDIQSIHCDAEAFELPEEPSIIYFYNPFADELMSRLVALMEKSFRRVPRELRVIFYGPHLSAPLEDARFLRKVRTTGDFSIYQAGIFDD